MDEDGEELPGEKAQVSNFNRGFGSSKADVRIHAKSSPIVPRTFLTVKAYTDQLLGRSFRWVDRSLPRSQ